MLGDFAETPLSTTLFRLVSAIQKHAGYRGAAPLGDAGGHTYKKIYIFLQISAKSLKKNTKSIISQKLRFVQKKSHPCKKLEPDYF